MGADENMVTLCGTVAKAPSFSHESHGQRYETMMLAIERLSGTTDTIRILAPEALIRATAPQAGDKLEITGRMRSYNNKSGQGSRLVLAVLAHALRGGTGAAQNHVQLTGALCKPPSYRKTPLGREICDLLLAVSRHYGRSDYLPCIAWGSYARACAQFGTGTRLKLEGRIQSRPYTKIEDGVEVTKTAYEISVSGVQQTVLPNENEKRAQ